ncbi:Ig domain-containing protein [Streptomyces sp. NPDC058287]|uniref:Ig domain-containing protein n=1 Tax=unclassified Streptomyces TaxID=2593676 RepID=UPI0036E4892D
MYESGVTTTPATVRYEVTDGALPAGLRLDKDTGGVTGTPGKPGTSTFTITARSTAGLADATRRYHLTMRP